MSGSGERFDLDAETIERRRTPTIDCSQALRLPRSGGPHMTQITSQQAFRRRSQIFP